MTFIGHDDVPNEAFSVELISTLPIVSQEVLIDVGGLLAHGTLGTTSLTTTAYFAEGFTGDSWLTFISVGNLGTDPATVTATYSLFGDDPVVRQIVVAPGARETFVAHEIATGVGPGFSFGVSISSDLPIVVQEVLIDPKPGVALAHNVMGSEALGTSFSFAGGSAETGWLTFISVTNPGSSGGSVTATYYFDSGPPVVRVEAIAANQRITFASNASNGPGSALPFAVKITATVPVVAQEVVISLDNFAAFGAIGIAN